MSRNSESVGIRTNLLINSHRTKPSGKQFLAGHRCDVQISGIQLHFLLMLKGQGYAVLVSIVLLPFLGSCDHVLGSIHQTLQMFSIELCHGCSKIPATDTQDFLLFA